MDASDEPVPDWELLPDQPQEFFELADGFERFDLKRAYNRLIRRFKPERCPAEFQRIRAAYEHLDEALRYGMLGETRFTPAPGLKAPGRDAESIAPSASTPIEPAEYPTLARLDAESPEVVLSGLTAHPEKSAANWVHQALIADALADDDPLVLFRTLVEGANATKGHPDVVHVLVEACHEETAVPVAGKLVAMLATLVVGPGRPTGFHPNWYYYASEHLWLELIAKAKFDGFRKLFRDTCARIDDRGHDAYLVLLFRLVRRGLFRADDDWIAAALEELYERYYQLPTWLQAELDVFEWLDRYRPFRATFVSGHPFREHVDVALCAIASGDELEADRAFLAAQTRALDETDLLLEAYPPGADIGPVVASVQWYGEQLVEQREELQEEGASSTHARQLTEFLYALERLTDRSLLGKLWNVLNLLKAVAIFFLVTGPWIVSAALIDTKGSTSLFWVVLLAFYALLVLAWMRGWIGRVFDWTTSGVERRIYDTKWRPKLVEFLGATMMPWPVLVSSLESFSDNRVTNDKHLLAFLSDDPGIALYAVALRFA